jgi:hypothetical protein
VSKAINSNTGKLKRVIGTWRLPASGEVIELVATKGPDEFDWLRVEIPEHVATELINDPPSSEGPDVGYEEDKAFFAQVVLPQARVLIGGHYVGRSDVAEWSGYMNKKWKRER